MTTTDTPPQYAHDQSRLASLTLQVGDDLVVSPQAIASDRERNPRDQRVAVFLRPDDHSFSVQLSGTPDDLRAMAHGIIDAATTIEQRQFARGVVAGF